MGHYPIVESILVLIQPVKKMSIVVPSEQFSHSHFYVIYYNPGFVSGFSSAYSASSPKRSSSGGGGEIGGGFGSGSGGAR